MNNKQAGWIVALMTLTVGALAWPAGADDNLLKPTNKTENWRLEQHEEAKATLSVDGDAIVVEVTNADYEAWHIQLFQTGLDLKNGKEYVVTYKAKAGESREIHVVAGIDQDDWRLIGLDEAVSLGTDWQDFKSTFTVSDPVEKTNRIGFQLGQSKGKVWFKDVTLKEAK